jgi:hypothetical protein
MMRLCNVIPVIFFLTGFLNSLLDSLICFTENDVSVIEPADTSTFNDLLLSAYL